MKLLALEASANTVSIAVQNGALRFGSDMPASSKTSAWLIPALFKLLDEAQLSLSALDAILFGQGPGAFTGLRTVCSVVQGLTLGMQVKVPIYAVDTLQELAQAAVSINEQELSSFNSSINAVTMGLAPPAPQNNVNTPMSMRMLIILDARMQEWYVGAYEYVDHKWTVMQGPLLCKPEQLKLPLSWIDLDLLLCSNVEWSSLQDFITPSIQNQIRSFNQASPNASLCLDLAPSLIGAANKPNLELFNPLRATPVYIRDRVALTTAERERAKLN